MLITNPIIRGFYPDPSICKANERYYMVCSSMQYFPGVPLFESEDLVNWKQIGHCLTKENQVNLYQINSSGGVFAPTIRYHEGVFYMVTTNDTYHKNFYVTTTDIYSEWSDPIFVDQGGIDPSLFFEDGKTYFMSNGNDESGASCILQCEINPQTGERLTESLPIWGGSGGRYLESPHLYHIGDWYYIMAAEGGTEFGHMITYARGTSPYGPFSPYPHNPVLTNRNLGGPESLIQGIGHGDLIDDGLGNFFIVCLGFRQADVWIPYHHLGREVFLVPVAFDENGWFTAGMAGTVRDKMEMPLSICAEETSYDASISLLLENPHRFCYLRTPNFENYQITEDKILLKGTNITLEQADSPTFLGIRQSEFKTDLRVNVSCSTGEAGITFYMDESHHYDLALSNLDNGKKILLRLCIGDLKVVVNEFDLPAELSVAALHITSDSRNYYFFCSVGVEDILLGTAQAKYLSSEVAGGFTGVIMAMYAINSQEVPDSWAEFSSFIWKQY